MAEHGAVLSEVTVSRYVTRRRVEPDLVHVQVCIPRSHDTDAQAEVDVGEFDATIAGQLGDGLHLRNGFVALRSGVPYRLRHPGAEGVSGIRLGVPLLWWRAGVLAERGGHIAAADPALHDSRPITGRPITIGQRSVRGEQR